MARKIPTSRLQVGDVLAESVVHGEGQALLAAGTAIESHHLDLLRQRGVVLVTIVAEDPEEVLPPRELDPEELKAVIVETSRWFGESRKDPIMAEVFRFAVQLRAREKQREPV